MIASLCITAALGAFKMECLKRNNNINFVKKIEKTDNIQKDREYLIADMDSFIYSNAANINAECIKELLTKGNHKSWQDKSYMVYNKDKDVFYLCYYVNGIFLMEEILNYTIENGEIYYTPLKFSYKQGVL
ncbi:MAG: hypothetical protein ACM3X7_05070 [Solirubrobacterales bacterium]